MLEESVNIHFSNVVIPFKPLIPRKTHRPEDSYVSQADNHNSDESSLLDSVHIINKNGIN